MKAMQDVPIKCCLNCHFCMEESLNKDRVRGDPVYVTNDQAREMANGILSESAEALQGFWFYCGYKVYSNRSGGSDGGKFLIKDRKETCFFFPRNEGMNADAAGELEKRAANRREAEHDRALTRRAFWVAVGVLLASILATIVNFALN